jgi:hypothetical protein
MADPKATPLNALPKGPQGNENDGEFIKKIMSQMNADNAESEQAYSQTQQNYQAQQFAVDPSKQHAMNQQQLIQEQQQQQYQDESQYEQQYEEEPELTTGQKIKNALKPIGLFIIVFFVLNLPFLRNLITNQVARFTASETLQIYGGTIILGLIGSLVFYFVLKFIH